MTDTEHRAASPEGDDHAAPTQTKEPAVPDLAEAFGLRDVQPESLTRFARVHRARTSEGTEVVVKVTGRDPDRSRAMADWTRALAGAGVPVVTPVALPVDNPQQVGEHWWVVYPFQEGAAYTGTPEQIETAGELLGLIHAAGVEPDGLRDYEWPETAREDVDGDLEALGDVLSGQGDPAAIEPVRALAERWWQQRASLRGRDAELPRCAQSSDYKANNLVWSGPVPTLVDPDNGGREPRLFELAFVATLFHNECAGAPGRLLDPAEWARFLAGYHRHVRLTEAERELWPLVFDHILWEEGTWVLEDNDEEAWADPRQRAFLLALARADVKDFPLTA